MTRERTKLQITSLKKGKPLVLTVYMMEILSLLLLTFLLGL
ncbi:hypothetical protein B4092_4938 [Bacillus licheniformis]|nr:hypothetical protein B4092_4938 [Bacillus licheniformis]